jgi:uncharacterized protein YbaR (Trm112 family)
MSTHVYNLACPSCKGTGTLYGRVCPACNGRKVVQAMEFRRDEPKRERALQLWQPLLPQGRTTP